MSKPKTSIRIEVFRSGTFTPMSGAAVTYSADDLAGIAASYDFDAAPAPVVIGHPKTDDPAYGWVSGFEYDADADLLFADIGDLEPEFVEAVEAGRYKKVSMSFHMPDAPNNPTPGQWSAKHIGFLGGAAPAVSGLKPVQFSEGKDGEVATFEAAFGEAGFENTADMFRSIRDWFIEKSGLEMADRILPSYRIEWLADTEIKPNTDLPLPSFSAPIEKDTNMTPEELAAEQAKLTARTAELDARDASFAADEATRRGADHVTFAEALVAGGQLLPASQASVVALLDALPADQSVSFAEGEAAPLADALMSILKAQPKMVDFAETDLGVEGDLSVDPDKIAEFALAHKNELASKGIEISISDAVEHISKGAAK